MITKAPRGTNDIFGDGIKKWHEIESTILKLTKEFGFGEIRTPMFEHTELFLRGVGETTDIVQKEMYTFEDKGDRSITLKPEGTAGVARAFLENKMFAAPQPTRLFYIAPAFRYEKPQAGRMRQFHQFGVEMFGSSEATADAEVISLANSLLNRVGIKNVQVHINSLGGPECRQNYNKALKQFLSQNLEELCPTCQERFEKNPLRVLDCKNEKCKDIIKDAPVVLDVLGEECKKHFDTLQKLLKAMNIPYVVDSLIVRGLDYYTQTVFEFISDDIGSQGTICGGGRYDKLVEECGGKPMPAVGFGVGLERLIMVLEAQQGKVEYPLEKDIFVASIGENALFKAHSLAYELRNAGFCAEVDHLARSVKAQMKYANKVGAKYAMVLGDDELQENKAVLRNMNTREEKEVELDKLIDVLKMEVK